MLDVQESYRAASVAAEQERRIRRLFSAVVMEALDEAIEDDIKFSPDNAPTSGPDKLIRRYNVGRDDLLRWAESADGRMVLTLAGIEPGPRTAANLVAFVERGVRTAVALSAVAHEKAS